MSRKLIIDTDCGIDDTSSTLLALSSADKCNVIGITIVAGNTDASNGVENIKKILALAKRTDIPIYKGCGSPMISGLFNVEKDRWPGHDTDGFGGFSSRKEVCFGLMLSMQSLKLNF